MRIGGGFVMQTPGGIHANTQTAMHANMLHLLITKIELFDPRSESASDSGQMVVFCFPCSYEVGDHVPNRLHVHESTKLQLP